MTLGALSLRLRLFVVILTPLLAVAILLGIWRYWEAKDTAEQFFDRALLSAALAISRDVAVSGGDAISPTTRNLVLDAAGGEVFYHVTGPDGIYRTGYAYPPVGETGVGLTMNVPQYSVAPYRGEAVRVLKLSERVVVENLSGTTTITVWQRMSERRAFAIELAVQAAALMGALLATLGVVVWYGVNLGLRPLADLHDAIASRTAEDLSIIKRAVPVETQGIVHTLNRLFGQVQTSMEAHKTFISDAAHQLRNPAAAVQSLTLAVRDAKTDEDRRRRLKELEVAARSNAHVAQQLLSLDRLQQPDMPMTEEDFDLTHTVREICTQIGSSVLSQGIGFEFAAGDHPLWCRGDPVMLGEAIKNLIDNAVKHGGAHLKEVKVSVTAFADQIIITVYDDGTDLTPADAPTAFSRFGQIEPSSGSGLGLAIAASIADRHKGILRIDAVPQGASLSMVLPRVMR